VVSPLSTNYHPGLGHRFGGIVFAYHIANFMGASLKTPPQYLNKTGTHGSFPPAGKLLSDDLFVGYKSHYIQRSMNLRSYGGKHVRIPCSTHLLVGTNAKFCHSSLHCIITALMFEQAFLTERLNACKDG